MCPVEVGVSRGVPGVEQLRIAVVGIIKVLQHNKSGEAVCIQLLVMSHLNSTDLQNLEARALPF